MVEIVSCPTCGRPRALGHPCPTCAYSEPQPSGATRRERPPRAGRRRVSPLRIIIALAVFFGLVYGGLFLFQLAAGAGGGASTADVAPYSNARGQFSIEYPASWAKLPLVSVMGESGTSVYAQVAFGDPAGPRYNDLLVDFVAVQAVKLPVTFTEAMRPAFLSAIKQQVAQSATQSSGLQVSEPVSEFTVNGLQGVKVGFTTSLADRGVIGQIYVVPVGAMQYQIAVQAAESDWQTEKPRFDAFVNSFSVTAGYPQG